MKTRVTTGLICLIATIWAMPALAQNSDLCEPTIVRASSQPMPSPYWQAAKAPPAATQPVRQVRYDEFAENARQSWQTPAPTQLPLTLVDEFSGAASQPPTLAPNGTTRPFDPPSATVIQKPPVVYHSPPVGGTTTVLPTTTYRPILPPPPPGLAPRQYLGKGLWGQTKVYGSSQPIRNFLRFISF